MKLQLIASICKSTLTLAVVTGIFLLCLKGIIPVYTILFLWIAGGVIRFLIRAFSFIAVILIILILIGMAV